MTARDIQYEIEILKLKLRIKELEAELSRRSAIPVIPAQSEEEERKERQSHSWPMPDRVGHHEFVGHHTGAQESRPYTPTHTQIDARYGPCRSSMVYKDSCEPNMPIVGSL